MPHGVEVIVPETTYVDNLLKKLCLIKEKTELLCSRLKEKYSLTSETSFRCCKRKKTKIHSLFATGKPDYRIGLNLGKMMTILQAKIYAILLIAQESTNGEVTSFKYAPTVKQRYYN